MGVPPQDLKYKGEPTSLEIGNRNVIREYVTISRGTRAAAEPRAMGDDCLIMAYAHIGHDSRIGNQCILANAATLAGHVTIEDYATVGALCPVHQFCRIGRYAFIGGGYDHHAGRAAVFAHLRKAGNPRVQLEKVGLQRRGFSPNNCAACTTPTGRCGRQS